VGTTPLRRLPPAEASTIEELAKAYVEWEEELIWVEKWIRTVRRKLVDEVVHGRGPVDLGDAVVDVMSGGYDYDEDGIAGQLPGLLSHMQVTVTLIPTKTEDAKARAGRLIGIVDEEFPGAEVTWKTVIDKRRAAKLAATRGRNAEILAALRTPRNNKLLISRRT